MPALIFKPSNPVFIPKKGVDIVKKLLSLLRQKSATYTVVNHGEIQLFYIGNTEPFTIECIGNSARLTVPAQYAVNLHGLLGGNNVQVINNNCFHIIQMPGMKKASAVIYTANEGFATGLARLYPPKQK